MGRRLVGQHLEQVLRRRLGLQVGHVGLLRHPVGTGIAAGVAGDEDMVLALHLAVGIGLEESAFGKL